MKIIATPADELHQPPHEFLDGKLVPMFETAERAQIIRRALAAHGFGTPIAPESFDDTALHAVHAAEYLAYLPHAYERWIAAGGTAAAVLPSTLAVRWMRRRNDDGLAAPGYFTFDLSAPIGPGTWQAARAAADVALTGAQLLTQGEHAAYALCRPPGHHAGSDLCGGYCFLNNAAIAAQWLRGHAPRVAVLDIDFHHGNGTQQIFYERDDVLFVSLHGDPARHYPYFLGYEDEIGAGAGLGYNHNIALQTGTTDATFLAALDQALRIVAAYAPGYLVISAGVDTYGGDPVADNSGGFALTSDAFPVIGRRIAALGIPSLVVQEGGYAVVALGENVAGLLTGFLQR